MSLLNTGSVFASAIQNVIDSEFPESKPAPDYSTSRRLGRTYEDMDVCSPKTTESAAARPDREKRSADRSALYDYYVAIGLHGAIREQAMDDVGLPHESGYPRLSELVHTGKLVPTGEKRRTVQGNLAAVLVADIHGGARPEASPSFE